MTNSKMATIFFVVLGVCFVRVSIASTSWTDLYAAANYIPGPGHFKEGFTQATVMVYEDDSVVATLATGKMPSQYAHPIVHSKATRRAQCATARFTLGNLLATPMTVAYPTRYAGGVYGQVVFVNAAGYAQADVPLRNGQAAVAIPNGVINGAKDQNLIVTIKIFNSRGQEATLRYLPPGNHMNAIGSTPRNKQYGRENDFVEFMAVGGVDFVAIVPLGFCT